MPESATSDKCRRVGGLLMIWATATTLGAVLPIWLAFQLAAPQPGLAALPKPDMQLRIIADERQLVRIVGRVSVERARDVFSLYGYELEAVREGDLVPPIFVRAMPRDIGEIIDTDLRKDVFAETVLPLILMANAEIARDRRRLLALIEAGGGDLGALTMRDRRWLGKLAGRYGLEETDLARLQRRVDIVPPSLAVAQAAKESGWGTSRFAQDGNALFGQWVWNTEEGIEPEDPQATAQPYSVRQFPDISESVRAYTHNLNTHRAYHDFRALRAAQRAEGGVPDGLRLAGTLLEYSQRREAYVEELQGMIRFNDYHTLDRARLTTMANAGF